MSALLHHNGCIIAEEYKSILRDQEHPGVQPVFPYDVPIFLSDNALTFTVWPLLQIDSNLVFIVRLASARALNFNIWFLKFLYEVDWNAFSVICSKLWLNHMYDK